MKGKIIGIENPRKTRQSVFLEQQTKAGIDKEGILLICPKVVSADCRSEYGDCINRVCHDCRKEFWSQ